ncbi:maleylpyruvate isomerase family mycothiol-dependent enzyme [Glycomyces tritici]|uniref:Maleylpyruvate isomerase family mycothiol-dependent enzyme n=1 Tax=Glycomyces tritici TaxID=2665176 RepID=A0ABT7YT21_9ACTN|nr:maleylpyruvate isomerase family mycothiol-dependent enzyme [Glycomyces tritici]MDN3241798.1 maleylpyruvate isomerase family mycothiol-dependent enzyme [Glycomyces tritici]
MTEHATSRTRTGRRARLWRMIHAERAALAADLAGLGEDRWATPSLCEGLSVRDVLAHLTSGATIGWPRWMAGVIKCRFDFDEQLVMRLREQLGVDPAETLARFDRAVASTSSPIPLKAVLGESIVHGEDIRRPLGLSRTYPVEAITLLAEYYRGSDFVVVAKKRVHDLRLAATDGPFEAGTGPLVSGPTVALVMAMTGRAAFCDDLEGDGVPVLRERCSTTG